MFIYGNYSYVLYVFVIIDRPMRTNSRYHVLGSLTTSRTYDGGNEQCAIAETSFVLL